MSEIGIGWLCGAAVVLALAGQSVGVTELWSRGYCVMPTPQQVELEGGDVAVGASWGVRLVDVGAEDIAVRTLLSGLQEEHGLRLAVGAEAERVIALAVRAGAVATGTDEGRERQGYLLRSGQKGVEITGNSRQGLFYGVQTLLQLFRPNGRGELLLPKGTIRDWPGYELRILHWDTKHHQDRMETLKRYLDWSAKFKVNAIAFELEDKFAYPSLPVIGAPGAFTTAQMQEVVRYGLERHIQIIPDVQAPAHMGYVLKHPEFASLRSDGSNYQICMCLEEAKKLIFQMYSDVIEATPGVEYFFVSTDEVYYAGIDPRCGRPYNPVNRSLTWVEYVQAAHEFLSGRGRRVLVWAEYPLLTEHVGMLPADIIDGIIGGDEEFIRTENERGIRQLAYVSMQGAELLFPNDFAYTARGRRQAGRLEQAYAGTVRGKASRGNPIGTFAAAWDDAGLHNETFWLGWAMMAEYGWTPGRPELEQAVSEFMRIYYGPDVQDMVEVYRGLQQGARFWEDSWRRMPSRVRGPGYGSSRGKGIGTQRSDLTLPVPQIPALPELTVERVFRPRCGEALSEVAGQLRENERVICRLEENFPRAIRNRYNLEVLLSLARFERHFMELLVGLDEAESSLVQAAEMHKMGRREEAVGLMVQAHGSVRGLVEDLDKVYGGLKAVFEKSRYPKGRAVDGREFVHVMDDVKDHFADRRADLSFMIAPEQSLELGKWCTDLEGVIRAYAGQHGLAVKGLAGPVLED